MNYYIIPDSTVYNSDREHWETLIGEQKEDGTLGRSLYAAHGKTKSTSNERAENLCLLLNQVGDEK